MRTPGQHLMRRESKWGQVLAWRERAGGGGRRTSPLGCVCSPPPLKGSILGWEEVEDGIGAPIPSQSSEGTAHPHPFWGKAQLPQLQPGWGVARNQAGPGALQGNRMADGLESRKGRRGTVNKSRQPPPPGSKGRLLLFSSAGSAAQQAQEGKQLPARELNRIQCQRGIFLQRKTPRKHPGVKYSHFQVREAPEEVQRRYLGDEECAGVNDVQEVSQSPTKRGLRGDRRTGIRELEGLSFPWPSSPPPKAGTPGSPPASSACKATVAPTDEPSPPKPGATFCAKRPGDPTSVLGR